MKKKTKYNKKQHGDKRGYKNPVMEAYIRVSGGGTGYITDEDGQDIRIPHANLNTALDGDLVKVSRYIKPSYRGDVTGEVLEVLKRKRMKFVGTFYKEDNLLYVSPDNKRMYAEILIPEKNTLNAKEGQKVYAEITKWTTVKKAPLGKILEIIGKKGDHETEMRSIILENQIETGFPALVENEAKNIDLDINEKEISKRKDFRNITTFTIDPVTAKDFDDAISFKELPNGNYEIGVHIADVSHYVRPGTEIDKEARERAFSVYLVDRTIPMLPEKLSNDICSLNPKVERLAFAAIFEITPEAKIKNSWFGKTVIKSDKRFTYEEAQEIIDKKSGQYSKELLILDQLSKTIRDRRMKDGAILFERDEVKIELNEKGAPVKIYRKGSIDTNKLVEEFMLLANKGVAERIENFCKSEDLKKVFVYRVHDVPDREKLEELNILLKAFGHELKIEDEIDPQEINKLLKKVKGTPEENLINMALIRSMAKAEYSTKNIGHFGLSFKFYTHFTSPIRRYPDLLVHRLLEKHLDGSKISKDELSRNQQLALSASKREIEIARAERESIKMKQVEFLKDRIGETFEGTISGVTEWGIYVEELETGADGLIKLSDINDDYYTLDKKFTLKGEKTGKKFHLGDKVKVKLIAANVDERTLDFVFV